MKQVAERHDARNMRTWAELLLWGWVAVMLVLYSLQFGGMLHQLITVAGR
jgi:hypothetical protein